LQFFPLGAAGCFGLTAAAGLALKPQILQRRHFRLASRRQDLSLFPLLAPRISIPGCRIVAKILKCRQRAVFARAGHVEVRRICASLRAFARIHS